ncbi:monooxygenase, putative [Talaromyces marneffei ATCC 18224]|uniref:Monooxygenase, putative n=1 Tax=Talaromyces marneffei (strain ATCC 18224 / CBS 334.59 / QM 7333) TaxID=441960 RepID=B6Q5Q3_TALMQ|nr:monooxygenase, putative [Talaromyces marneffei ATCC 18224]
MAKPFVLIVGAGPSGVLLAIMLGKQGIPVKLLEMANELDDRPRAAHYAPVAVMELQRAGVFEDIKAAGGFFPDGVCWRKLHGDILTTLYSPKPEDVEHPLICLPLNQLNGILRKHLDQIPAVELLFNHKVTDLGQDENAAWVTVETPEGEKTFTADYIVGCDGANSLVRRKLFGDLNFPGFTWDEQIVATNIYYPFEKYGFTIDSSFIIHPEHWYMAARITTDGMWRVSYGELPGLSFEELKERQPMKFKTMLPGNPEPEDYRMVNFSPYKIHQRLAESMRVGRFLLAADAAHLCNPFGGLGLTGGIVDIGNLYDCLYGIYKGYAGDSILDLYNKVRREKYNDIINPVSSENIRRLFDQDPDLALEEDEFLKMLKRGESDPSALKGLQAAAMALQYDFTKHYHNNP